jgi:hypothetical protein
VTIDRMDGPRLLVGAMMRPAAGAVSSGMRFERAVREAAGRRLNDVADELARRAVDRAFRGPLVDVIAEDIVRYAVVERVMDRLLAEGIVERALERVLDGPELERVVTAVLESEELWVVVEEVAQSPAVTEAVTQQSLGFADQVAGRVRARSRNADAWLERTARRALRRPPQ